MVLDLALDRDGILHVAALEKNTGLERRISIDQAVARYGAAELQQARERIGSLFGQDDADGPMGGDAVSSGDAEVAALLDKASAKLDTVGDEDRHEMIDLMETIRDAQAAGDAAMRRAGADTVERSAVLSRDLTRWRLVRCAARA